MRNRHDGNTGWWDDLPPRVKARFAGPPAGPAPGPPPERPRPSRVDWLREVSQVLLLITTVAVANVLFLLLALSFVDPARRVFPPPAP